MKKLLPSLGSLSKHHSRFSTMSKKKTLLLFDVDGTLTKPVQTIERELHEFMMDKVKPVYSIGLVGGSDLKKISRQMGGESVLEKYNLVFAENGLVAYKEGVLLASQSIQREMGEEKLQAFINFALGYLSRLSLPIKRGTFIEFRTGMVNVSPIGRNCSLEERLEFCEYDRVHGIREKMIAAMKKEFPDLGLTYSIGGQISIDVFPHGWDKTYCLDIVQREGYEEIHFFGDKTQPGGNDHEIYKDPRTVGHTVISPRDTQDQLIKLLQDS